MRRQGKCSSFMGPFAQRCRDMCIICSIGVTFENMEGEVSKILRFISFFLRLEPPAHQNPEKRGYKCWNGRGKIAIDDSQYELARFGAFQGNKTWKIQFRVYKNSKTRASKFPNTLLVSKVNWRGTTRLYEELWIWYFCWLTVQWVGVLGKT